MMADFIDLKEVRDGKNKVFSYRGPDKGSIIKGLITAAIILLIVSLSTLVNLHIDSRWFEVLGFGNVFWTNLGIKISFFGFSFALVFLFFYLNSRLASRLSGLDKDLPFGLLFLISMAAGIIGGISVLPWWLDFLKFKNAIPFNTKDPVFGLDISFYTFHLPLYEDIYAYISILFFLGSVAAAVIYLISSVNHADRKSLALRGMRHVGTLVAVFLSLKFFGYRLSAYDLVYSQLGSVFGAGASDIHAKLPALLLSSWLVVGVALITLFIAYNPQTLRFAFERRTAAITIVILFLFIPFALNVIWPNLYQTLSVAPDEITKETPFLKDNIAYTRQAFGLDKIKEVNFPANQLTPKKIQDNPETVENIRVLDYRAFEDTLGQQQEMRLYYHFPDVDVDRYNIKNKVTQVLVAPRELDASEIPENARNFNNLSFKYTHGFGLAMSPANRVTRDGLPEYLIKDIPPVVADAYLNVQEPRIYFGQLTDTDVVVNTKIEEFDYPQGDTNKTTTYKGKLGIKLSPVNKLAFAFKEFSLRYLLADAITGDSQMLFRRNIFERVDALAPFLLYDPDPYVVKGSNGKIYWIMDAYTTTDYYPYSESVSYNGQTFNYIRNSVKVVIDAYTGEVRFYVFDDKDALIKTYQKIYPSLFKSRAEFPDFLKDHIRYPELLFKVQSEMLSEYHMKNPVVFFNREDKWSIPQEMYAQQRQDMEPYYSVIQIPGDTDPEFVLMRPFTPAKKQNMISWLAARSDHEHYGELLLYKFPKGKMVSGPMMMESRIDQDSYISKELTLWGQGGSKVLRGNMLVLPMDDAILYVEPLYIIADQNKFPQLKKVIVAYEDNLIMADTLQEGLRLLFNGETGDIIPGQQPGQVPDENAAPQTQDALISQIIKTFNDAQKFAQENNWAAYGQAQDKLAGLIRELDKRRNE